MKRNIDLLGVLFVLLMGLSCSSDIADAVYHKEEIPQSDKEFTLTVQLKNEDEGSQLFVAALAHSPFNEQGESAVLGEQDFLLQQPVKNQKAVFSQLKDYYKTTLFFNVFEKKDDAYRLISHLGNQLEYSVTFGSIMKSIDLKAGLPETIKKTVIDVTVDEAYNDKVMYLVKEDQQSKMESYLQTGSLITDGMFVSKSTSKDGKVTFSLHTPRSTEKYTLYLVAPETGLIYLKKAIEITSQTTTLSQSFARELRKQIAITINRTDDKKSSEVYLIEKSKWNVVKQQVEVNHGSPELGSYVEKKVTATGKVSFEMFCTEGTLNYVVFVPKWGSIYYDNKYEMKELAVTPEKNLYELKIGAGEKKTVSFTISMAPGLSAFAGYPVFVLNDATKLNTVWYDKIMSGTYTSKGLLYSSTETVTDASSVLTIENVEIDSSKRIAVIVATMKDWNFAPAVKYIDASEITGDAVNVTVSEIVRP